MPNSGSLEPAAISARPDPTLPGGRGLFLSAIGSLAILRIALGYCSFPLGWLPSVNLLLAVVFLTVPVIALYFGANARWTWKQGAVFVAGGVFLQAVAILVGTYLALPEWAGGLLVATAQAALVCWCVGLGALLATLIREKNIILPIAIFLAAYDFFLVLTPWGFTQKLLKIAQPVFAKVAAQIPAVSAAPTHGLARPGAYVGMADLVFLGMFFIALFRFRMKTRQTLAAVLPALVVYLLIVLMAGGRQVCGFPLSALPAMVPIGLAVLLVNWSEFRLTNEEKLSTLILAILAVAFLTFAATRPKPPVVPAPSASGQVRQGSADSPRPAPEGPPR